MMTAMTSKQRMLAALTRQGPDHVPFSTYIGQGPWWEEPLRWRDQFERAEKMLALGLDPTIDIWFPDPVPHPDVEIRTWRDTSGEEPLLTKEYHTPAGILRQVARETHDWISNDHTHWTPTTFGAEQRQHYNMDLFDDWCVSRHVEPWVKGPEDLDKLRYIMRLPEGHVLDEWRMDTQRAIEFADRHGLLVQARRTIVGDAFLWFCDSDDFMVWTISSPDFVKEFLAIFQDWALGLTQLAAEAGVDVVQRRGWYEVPMYWGPDRFREFLVPLIEEETQLTHDAGKLHSYLLPEGQGTYASILKEMAADNLLGIDPKMLHGGDMASLADQLGDTHSFWGGVNAEVALESEDPAVIESEVAEAIRTLGRNGGLILSAFIFQNITVKSIQLMIDAWRKHKDSILRSS